jgi:cobalt-zinc-cadmium efflux system outer membrane protein
MLLACLLAVCRPQQACAQTELSLKQTLVRAAQNNPTLKVLFYDVEQTKANIVTAGLRPNIDVNNQFLASFSREFYPDGTRFLDPINYQNWIQVTKILMLPPVRSRKIGFAKETVRVSERNYTDAQVGVFQSIAAQWMDLWYLRRSLQINRNAQVVLDSIVLIDKIRLQNQVITPTDLARSQLLLSQYALERQSLEQSYRVQIRNLQLLLGTADSIDIDEADPISLLRISENLDSLLATAADYRTDLALAQSQVQLNEANLRLQKALALPQPEAGFIINPQNNQRYGGWYLTMPLPVFNRNQGEIQRAQVLASQAKAGVELARLRIRTELATALQAYQRYRELERQYEQVLGQSNQIRQAVKYSYLKGGTSIIDFFDAQRNWLETQKRYLDALNQYRRSYLDLLFSSGLVLDYIR